MRKLLRGSCVTMVLVLSTAMAQQIDSACFSRCTTSGSAYAYCQSLCTYNNQNRPVVTIDPRNFDFLGRYMQGQEQRRQQQVQEEQLRVQRELAESQQALMDEQRRAIQMENQRREAELQQSQPPQPGQGPAPTQREIEVMTRWQSAAAPRMGRYPDFAEVALAPDVIITMDMIELMSSSPYAADIAYYLGKNKAKSMEIAQLPLLRQAEEIRKIEQLVQAGPGGL